MYKNFIQNIGLKEHITAVHEERDSIMINVAKNLHYLKVYIEIVHKKNFEFNCDHCGKNFTKVFNLEIHIQTLNEHWTEITAVYENKNFNCDQCGKYFAR